MDFTPFTLFAIFILDFQVNMVRLYVSGNPIDHWPQECMGRNYCNVRPKDYPSDEYLTKLYLAREIDLPPEPAFNETEQRDGDMCRKYKNWAESIYMIKDEQDRIRYAFNVPEVYTLRVETESCHADQMLRDDVNIKCEEKYTNYPLFVLNEDHNKIQSAKVKVSTSCALFYVNNDYDIYDY